MKSLHPQTLRSKQMLASIPLIFIGILWLYNSFMYEYNLGSYLKHFDFNNYVFIMSNPKFDIMHGMWALPLCFGIILFLDSVNIIPEGSILDYVKKTIKYKIKEGKRDLKKCMEDKL